MFLLTFNVISCIRENRIFHCFELYIFNKIRIHIYYTIDIIQYNIKIQRILFQFLFIVLKLILITEEMWTEYAKEYLYLLENSIT